MKAAGTGRRDRHVRSVKIVVTGPFGAGKTSLISTISEIDVLSTEQGVSDGAVGTKSSTTVAMDFGRLTIDADLALYLFGTPGQKRFDFMWEILAEGMLGFVVLVDASRAEATAEAAEILHFFRETASVPYVVAVNKWDGDAAAAVAKVRKDLELPADVRAIPCSALDRESVKSVLLELLYAVLDEVEELQPAAV
jgi:small GTP-binding protein